MAGAGRGRRGAVIFSNVRPVGAGFARPAYCSPTIKIMN